MADLPRIKTVPDFPRYTISDAGEVVSYVKTKPQVLKPYDNGIGYLHLQLWEGEGHQIGNKGRYRLIHRLVAEAFILNPEKRSDVHHIDGNKRNNHYSNLEWWTTHQTAIAAGRIGGAGNRAKWSRINEQP